MIKRERRTTSIHIALMLAATLLLAGSTQAKNQGCCVMKNGDCTTATKTICNNLGGALQGVGTQICNDNKCSAGVGCASCFGGPYAGDLCEVPADCGKGGLCLANVSDIPAVGDLRKTDVQPLDVLVQRFPIRQYAAKFVCGNPGPRQVDLANGQYRTLVNVHNPQLDRTIFVRLKVAVANPGLEVGPITPFETISVIADGAFQVDCPTILDRLNEAIFAEGFVVLQSPFEFDVVAVYTAADPAGSGAIGGSQVRSMHTERVPGRVLE